MKIVSCGASELASHRALLQFNPVKRLGIGGCCSSLAPQKTSSYTLRVPTVYREAGCAFYFYAEEGTEPPHVHVDKGDGTAKLWLQPVRLAWAEGLKVSELRQIIRIAERRQEMLLNKWNEFFETKD